MKNSDCKLREDEGNGEGNISLSERFKRESPIYRADVLKDWLHLLEAAYIEARQAMRGVRNIDED